MHSNRPRWPDPAPREGEGSLMAERGLAINEATWRSWGRTISGRPGGVRRPAVFLLLICLIATAAAPALLTSSSFLVVAAVGEGFVVQVGMIDLGVESMIAASGMFIAWMTVFQGVSTPFALFATLGAGAGIGAIVGLLVARGGIPSFIVTLATYWGIRGVALLFNQGNYISPDAVDPPRPFGFAGIADSIGGVPVL